MGVWREREREREKERSVSLLKVRPGRLIEISAIEELYWHRR